jgi:hypothetical protein
MAFLRLIELDRGKNIHRPFREQKENPFYRFSAPPSFHTPKIHFGRERSYAEARDALPFDTSTVSRHWFR